jgi:MFS superfamily sulfate permease-like transporter
LTKVAVQLRSRGVRLLLARVDGERLALLRRAGALEAVGDENLFVTVRAAVRAGGSSRRPSTP